MSYLAGMRKRKHSCTWAEGTAPSTLQTLLKKGKYSGCENPIFFESTFLEVNEKGANVTLHNHSNLITMGILSSNANLEYPDYLVMAQGESDLEITHIIPIEMVEIFIHNLDQHCLKVKLSNGRSYYLKPNKPAEDEIFLLEKWMFLIPYLGKQQDIANKQKRKSPPPNTVQTSTGSGDSRQTDTSRPGSRISHRETNVERSAKSSQNFFLPGMRKRNRICTRAEGTAPSTLQTLLKKGEYGGFENAEVFESTFLEVNEKGGNISIHNHSNLITMGVLSSNGDLKYPDYLVIAQGESDLEFKRIIPIDMVEIFVHNRDQHCLKVRLSNGSSYYLKLYEPEKDENSIFFTWKVFIAFRDGLQSKRGTFTTAKTANKRRRISPPTNTVQTSTGSGDSRQTDTSRPGSRISLRETNEERSAKSSQNFFLPGMRKRNRICTRAEGTAPSTLQTLLKKGEYGGFENAEVFESTFLEVNEKGGNISIHNHANFITMGVLTSNGDLEYPDYLVIAQGESDLEFKRIIPIDMVEIFVHNRDQHCLKVRLSKGSSYYLKLYEPEKDENFIFFTWKVFIAFRDGLPSKGGTFTTAKSANKRKRMSPPTNTVQTSTGSGDSRQTDTSRPGSRISLRETNVERSAKSSQNFFLPGMRKRNRICTRAEGTAPSTLQTLLKKGEYGGFENAEVFESTFLEVNEKGGNISIHNHANFITMGVLTSNGDLEYPDYLVIAQGESDLEFKRLIPMEMVEIFVHNRDQRRLKFKLSNGTNYYLKLYAPAKDEILHFDTWMDLIYLQRSKRGTANTLKKNSPPPNMVQTSTGSGVSRQTETSRPGSQISHRETNVERSAVSSQNLNVLLDVNHGRRDSETDKEDLQRDRSSTTAGHSKLRSILKPPL